LASETSGEEVSRKREGGAVLIKSGYAGGSEAIHTKKASKEEGDSRQFLKEEGNLSLTL